MKKQLAGRNIVFVGNFQPIKFDKFFFVKNEIFQEDEITDFSIFSPEISQVIGKNINVVVLSQQIHIIPINNDKDRLIEVAKLLITTVRGAISALGVNFDWHLQSEQGLEKFSKEAFCKTENLMFTNFFDTPDSIFGSYVSKDFMGGRLKLEIKPQLVRQELETQKKILAVYMNYGFNFHFETDNLTEIENLVQALDDYDKLFSESNKIMAIYE